MRPLKRTPATVAAFQQLVDGSTGIVQDLRETAVAPGCPDLFVYGSTTADTRPFFGHRANVQNSGAAPTRLGARVAAVGEAVERYCTACWDRGDLRVGTWSELADDPSLPRPVHPDQLQLLLPGQTKTGRYASFSTDTRLAWAQVWSLTRRAPTMLPASQVFLPYRPSAPGESEVFGTYSTGVAAAANVHEATFFGLCEAIERDAFMNAWLNRLALPRVDHLADADWAADFARIYDRPGLRYHVLDATTDVGVPVAICALVDHAESPVLYSISAACHLDMRVAVGKAVLEAAHGYLWVRSLRERPRAFPRGARGLHSFEDHVAWHASGRELEATRFLWEGERPTRALDHHPVPALADFGEAVDHLVARLADVGVEATAAEVTTADVESLGIAVVRTFCPELIPLHAGMDCVPLACPRLYTLPGRMGLGPDPTGPQDLHTAPHPFP